MMSIRKTGTMRLPAVAALLAASLTACAPLPERAQEAREYRRADFENQFLDYRRRCHAAGKRIMIMANGKVGHDGVPNRGDYYTCS